MGGHNEPDQPVAYSDRVSYDADTGYHADGHQVVIKPDDLNDSIATFEKQLQGQNSRQLMQTLTDALGAADAFGQIPNADHAITEFTQFVQTHVEEMSKMSSKTLVEFIARVQAAAQLGYETDPATRAAAARAQRMME
jgi:hypothetical protein